MLLAEASSHGLEFEHFVPDITKNNWPYSATLTFLYFGTDLNFFQFSFTDNELFNALDVTLSLLDM
jgi:hypothetical protein